MTSQPPQTAGAGRPPAPAPDAAAEQSPRPAAVQTPGGAPPSASPGPDRAAAARRRGCGSPPDSAGGAILGDASPADATRVPRKRTPRLAAPMREPGITLTPGRPSLQDVGDDAAAFVLHREVLELPVIARFTIEGEPVSKSRARFTKRGSKTQTYTPEKTHQAEQVVGWQFRRAVPRHTLNPDTAYGVIALFFCGTRQRRDVDNMLKLILDGLNRVAWPDDEQVAEVSARKTLTIPEHARTEVAVYQVGTVQRFTKDCEHCGQQFPIFKSTNGQRYCSQECAGAARRQRPRVQKTCEGCGALFTGEHGRRYCSKECQYANGRTSVACSRCGIEFTKQKCHVRVTNYCSPECQHAAERERKKSLACGTCETCGGPTSKKTYRQCRPCRMTGMDVTGKPRAVAQ